MEHVAEPTPEPTMTEIMAAITRLDEHVEEGADALGAKVDGLGAKVDGLEDRLVQRTELLRADIAGLKAESAIEQAYGRDTAEALRRQNDRNAHGPRAA